MKKLFQKSNYSPGELSTGGKLFTYLLLLAGLSFFPFSGFVDGVNLVEIIGASCAEASQHFAGKLKLE